MNRWCPDGACADTNDLVASLDPVVPVGQVVGGFDNAVRRAKDDVDFAAVVGSLPREAKSWLAKAIHLAYGADHDWVDRLRG